MKFRMFFGPDDPVILFSFTPIYDLEFHWGKKAWLKAHLALHNIHIAFGSQTEVDLDVKKSKSLARFCLKWKKEHNYWTQNIRTLLLSKGQLILKCFFGIVDFLQKTNENNSHISKNEFIRSFFGGNRWPPKPFRNQLTFTFSLTNFCLST